MKYLILGVIISSMAHASQDSDKNRSCIPCYGNRKRPASPQLNRDYYLPPSQITWRAVSEEELKENDRKMTSSFQYRGTARLEGETYPHHRVQVGDGGGVYQRVGEESPQGYPSRRRSSSATTTLSDDSDSSDNTQDLDRPTTLCDRLRLSLAGICTQSKWVWTVPATTLQRQNSFVDSDQPGLQHRTSVVDIRKRVVPSLPFSSSCSSSSSSSSSSLSCSSSSSTTIHTFAQPLARTRTNKIPRTTSLYPYKSSESSTSMISIPGNNKPYAARKNNGLKIQVRSGASEK